MDLQALSEINLFEVELICILIVYKPGKSRFGKLKGDVLSCMAAERLVNAYFKK